MKESINPFNPSEKEFGEIMDTLREKLGETDGPNDEISIKAGDLVVLMAGVMRVKKKFEEAE